MTFRLRQARITDLPAIYRGEQDYIRCWEPDHEATWRDQLERHLTRWVDNFERITVACVGEQVAGYSLWIPEDGKAQLCTINVSGEHRRCGIGRALIDAYAMETARQGFSVLTLSVRSDNPARILYGRAGFVCMGAGAHDYLRYERHVW